MKILVKTLAYSSGYTLNYFFKLLRKSDITNRIILDNEDIIKLYNNLQIVNHKSYNLHISLKNIIDNNKGALNVR